MSLAIKETKPKAPRAAEVAVPTTAVAKKSEEPTVQELQSLLRLAEQKHERAENLVGLALEMGASLSLPDLVRSFGTRAGKLMGAKASAVGLCHEAARGPLVETVVFDDSGLTLGRDLQHQMGEFLSAYASTRTDSFFSGPAATLMDSALHRKFGWQDILIARLTGTSGELLGLLCLADCSQGPNEDNFHVLQALIGHASVALENSRLFSRIAQSNKQWAELFDSITDFIVVHDEDDLVMRINRPLAEFIGLRPAEIIGTPMGELMGKKDGPSPQACSLCQHQAEHDEFVHASSDRVFLLSSSRIRGGLNERLQIIHVLKDVTERREAERRYRELFDNVQEGVFFSSPDGRFVDVNDALVRMLGYNNREELLKIDIPTQFYASREQRKAAVNLLDPGMMFNKEVMLRRKNGSIIYALENAIAVRDDKGEIVQLRGTILDITEAKNFQAQLQRQRDFNTQILNNTQSMILVVDTAGLISYANRRCYEAGNFPVDALVGHRIGEIVAASDRATWRAAFERVLMGNPSDNLELQIVSGSGGLGKYSVNLSPMRGEQSTVTSVVVVMTDITEVANMQTKLMHTEKMAAVGQLVSGVAHEVNNPLTAILGFADLMLENPELPDSVHQDLRVIMQEAQRTKSIVQNLLSFARQMPKQRHNVDINSVLHKTISLRAYDFSSHGVDVIENFAALLPETVGDEHQLQQVFLNILNNAYDAVRETERRGSIEIATLASDGQIEIRFRDNGPGIQNAERIFDPFFTTKDVGKGTGLGLSICYGIIRQHGGEITCQNNSGTAGATFSVKLPVVDEWAEEAKTTTGAQER